MYTMATGRSFVSKVIKLFKSRPCLWDTSDSAYHDKITRNQALDDFLPLFRSVDPGANRETVQKKLASIRSSYNKECRKVRASLGSGSDKVHKPKLWYYDLLTFLGDPVTSSQSKTVKICPDEMTFSEEESDDKTDTILEKKFPRIEDPLHIPSEKSRQAHDAFGEHIAEKLRSLPKAMVPICQKLINDAIFLAECEQLDMSSKIVYNQVL